MTAICQKLRSGECVIGSWVSTCSAVVSELMAAAGFDFLAVDAEHAAVDVAQAQQLFQAMRSGNPHCAAMVRLPVSDYVTTKRYLDAGATGVIAPLINSRAQAQELVRAAKYPPAGARGVGFCRANMYGTDFDRAMATANEETLVCVQIEHVEALRHIDDILSLEGIDVALVGPYDLSASMGLVRQFDHPRYTQATEEILKACLRHNVAAGIHVVPPDVDELKRRMNEGYRFIAYSLDITMLATCCRQGLETVRKLR